MSLRKNPFDAATAKGRDAFLSGNPRSTCPYHDHRKADGRLTFGRAWQTAWVDGYELAFRHAIQDVLAGKSVKIGGSSISTDGPHLVITDPYGCDRYLNEPTEDSVRKAIVWAITTESSPLGEHPAERTYSSVRSA